MTSKLEEFTALLEQEISALHLGEKPTELYQPIHYIMAHGGKRLRPLLTLLSYSLFKDNWQQIIRPALAVEMFHNFTLMHDDIMDHAPLRRGKATVHKKWNHNVAILSGDVMMVKAYDLLLEVENEKLKKVLKAFNACAAGVCEGQQYDMNFEQQQLVSEEEYLYMISLKTSVLLGFSLELGAILGGAEEKNARLLYEFGKNIGMGFQLKDDLLDVYADKEKFGKQVGGDIIANKKTFLLIKALENATGPDKKTLKTWLNAKDYNKEEKVKVVTKIYDQLGIEEHTHQKMKAFFDAGFHALDTVDLPEEKKYTLKLFTQSLINRDK